MASDNNQDNSSSNPIGNPTDNAQQDWLGLDQQDTAGETLKAKKWTTKRRLVDDANPHGNIHTGSEEAAELEKGGSLSGDAVISQSLTDTERENRESFGSEEQLSDSQSVSSTAEIQDRTEEQVGSNGYDERTEADSVVTGGDRENLRFEEHFDNSTATERSATADKEDIKVVPAESKQDAADSVDSTTSTETPTATIRSESEPDLEDTPESVPSPIPVPESTSEPEP
ncbi:MAG: hypothetical protein KAR01_06930, partial [Desulfocapsa sp.]|nr:hypothetical protein [Desulfocapsa sp.]